MRRRQQGQVVTELTGTGVYNRSAELGWIDQHIGAWLCLLIANLIIIIFEHAGDLGRLIVPYLVKCNYN